MPAFMILNGPDAGRIFNVSDEPVSVGRGQDQGLILADDRSSRAHFVLEREGDKVFVRDLQSSNGTFLNGQLVQRQQLREGDVILVGHTEIRYGKARLESPPPPGDPQVTPDGAQPARQAFAYGTPTHVMESSQLGTAGLTRGDLIADPDRPSGPTRVAAESGPEATAIRPAPTTDAAMGGSDVYGAPTRIGAGAQLRGDAPCDLQALAKALVLAAAPLTAAKEIALTVEVVGELEHIRVDGVRLYPALYDVTELGLVLLRSGRRCALRVNLADAGHAALSLCAQDGPLATEHATARAIDGRFDVARSQAVSIGGTFRVAPQDEPGALWSLRVPLA